METAEFVEKQTKQCPFCAETILSAAIKCRYCGEFLNNKRAASLDAEPANGDSMEPRQLDKTLHFEARPSLWALFGTVFRALIFFTIAIICICYPIEDVLGPELSIDQAVTFARYRLMAGIAVGILIALNLAVKILLLKSIHYEVTPDRIEYSRGIFDKKIDNTDMFRVVDLKMRRSLLDCIVGVGSISLETTDKSDPQFTFKKVKNPRRLYDVIKKASLEADRRRSVIHLE